MPCNVKELEHCLETIPKNGISEIAFYQIIMLFFCVLRKVNGLRDILGWITCTILKVKPRELIRRYTACLIVYQTQLHQLENVTINLKEQ